MYMEKYVFICVMYPSARQLLITRDFDNKYQQMFRWPPAAVFEMSLKSDDRFQN